MVLKDNGGSSMRKLTLSFRICKVLSCAPLHCTGPMIWKAAETFAEKNLRLDKSEFCASQGWLVKFKERNNFVLKVLQGERGSAPIVTANAFKATLPDKLQDYEPRNISNNVSILIDS